MPHEINLADPSTLIIGERLWCACGNSVHTRQRLAYGWIDENWPTEGGGKIRVTICPGCRRPWPTEGEQA